MDLREVWDSSGLSWSLTTKLTDLDLEENLGLTKDASEYVYVDGEEGDYGIIRYLDSDNKLVLVKLIFGGDKEDCKLTNHGKQLIKQHLFKSLEETIDSSDVCSEEDLKSFFRSKDH